MRIMTRRMTSGEHWMSNDSRICIAYSAAFVSLDIIDNTTICLVLGRDATVKLDLQIPQAGIHQVSSIKRSIRAF
jgi:hypothetical protein